MSSPKFSVGQRVKRIEERESVGATVLEFIELNETVAYRIQYDEGSVGEGDDGTGWWLEETLTSETLDDIKARMGIA
jgi:hypothetical protein